MIITDEIKKLVEEAAFVPVTTVSEEGKPHLIVVGEIKEVKEDDILALGIYKMETTQKNIAATGVMQVALVTKADGPKGVRLSGQACIVDGEVLFKAEKAERLI